MAMHPVVTKCNIKLIDISILIIVTLFSFILCTYIKPSRYITGDVMPQNGMNYEGGRGGTRHNTCKANGQVPGTGLVNGAVVHNGCPADATRTSEKTPAGTLNDTKPQCMVDGYIYQSSKGSSTKAAPPRTIRRQGSTISAVTDASAAGRVRSSGTPGGISVNGDTGLDTVALPCNSDQMAPQPSLLAAAKIQRRRKKFRHKKRCATFLTAALNTCTFTYRYSLLSVKSPLYDLSYSYKAGVDDCIS